MRDYKQELEELRQGNCTELVVNREEFLTFREVWLKEEDRNAFVGEASLNGQITYRYKK
ncbi:hypothetical protein [Enterococcus italicus]|jgi:hypothetical protein|uniref:hypothetical protein n=1 Tax=Enterococcus italicus TaxID=246144 RepID=UPI0028ACA04C|nr:hypothetical protein [Enterococcus italicus]